MKLSEIIKIIKKNEYSTATAKGQRKSVDVDILLREIKSLQLEQSNKQKEYLLLDKLGFKAIQKDFFRVYEKDAVIFFDYRLGTRRSWALNIFDNTHEDKTELQIYSALKRQMQKLELKVENNINIVCDSCGNIDKNKLEIYGSPAHEVRKYKCLKCDRVFDIIK